LEALTASVREGAGGVVVLEGAAGIGKSRLLFEACERAADRGLVVAAGASDELDQVTPWGVVLRALCSTEPALLDASELESMRGLSDRRLAVVDRMRVALEAASEEQPLLVALDDLQWADPPTLLALGELPLQLFSYPIGWLLARRPMPTTTTLDGVLARLEAAGAARLHLAPLTGADSVAVATDVVGPRPDREIENVIAGAAGNPFYIMELLRAAQLEQAQGERDSVAGVPQTVRSAVAGHLRSLSAASRHLLSVASVLGREFSVAEVAAMTGEPASRLLEAVREALGAEVLTERSDRLAFRHDLLRQAVYEDLPESARVALHRDAGEALRSTGGSAVRIAGQLAIGARPGDAAAIDTLNDAVAELTPTSPSAAADLQLRALELIPEYDDRRAAMVLAAVHSLSLAGRGGEAFALGDRYLAEHRPPAAVEATLQLELREAWVFERVQAYPTPLPQRLLSDPTVDRAIVATAIACEHAKHMWDGRGEQAGPAFADAFRIVSDGGRPSDLATIAYLRVINSMLCGRMSDALAQAEAALEAARRVERPVSSGIHEMLVSAALGANGRYRDALATLRTALAATEVAGRTYFTVQCQLLRSFPLLAEGNLADARSEAQAAAAIAEGLGYAVHSSRGLTVLAEAAIRQGDRDQARSALARFASPTGAGYPDRPWALALDAHVRGDAKATALALAAIRAQLERGCFAISFSQHQRLPQLVQMALGAGEQDAAIAFARAAETLAAQNPHVDTILAGAAHARGLIDQDEAQLRDAVQKASGSEARLLEAAAREDLGRSLSDRADRPGAVEQLEAAYQIYAYAGADRDTARVRTALRALGIRKRRSSVARPTQGWESLTKSEATVVDLVARGLTNRQAAAELFLSPATINTHLVHAFTKLGIRSRVELARIAAERTAPPD
jgi:DNA-binding CsgD family transcriptional regulator